MTLDILKIEALKLEKSELFDFIQFVIETLKKESASKFDLSDAQNIEIFQRLKDIENNASSFLSGIEA